MREYAPCYLWFLVCVGCYLINYNEVVLVLGCIPGCILFLYYLLTAFKDVSRFVRYAYEHAAKD